MDDAQPDSIRRVIDAAVERGIISVAQRDAIATLSTALSGEGPVAVEAPRGFNSITIAYVIGAMLVVFAFGWFLIDRWESLGRSGILVVVSIYAALLVGSALWLERRRFTQAAGIALMLAVALTPVACWALLGTVGAWPLADRSDILSPAPRDASLRWLLVDVSALVAAGAALRWRRSVAITLPLALALWFLWLHTTRLIAGDALAGPLDRWLWVANGLAICAVAGEIDRWQAARRASGRTVEGDFAFFFWIVGLLVFAGAYMAVWLRDDAWKHVLPLIALSLVVLSLYLRRRTHLVFGLLGLFGYLAYLAADVFKDYLSLPVTLGALGIVLILMTVWMQRRFPRLVERVNADRGGAVLPRIATSGPVLIAMAIAIASISESRTEAAQRATQKRLDAAQPRRDSGSAGRKATEAAPQPTAVPLPQR